MSSKKVCIDDGSSNDTTNNSVVSQQSSFWWCDKIAVVSVCYGKPECFVPDVLSSSNELQRLARHTLHRQDRAKNCSIGRNRLKRRENWSWAKRSWTNLLRCVVREWVGNWFHIPILPALGELEEVWKGVTAPQIAPNSDPLKNWYTPSEITVDDDR